MRGGHPTKYVIREAGGENYCVASVIVAVLRRGIADTPALALTYIMG